MATWRHTFLSIPQLEDVKMWPLGRNPDCGIREIFVCRIRNLRKFCLWNPESWVCGISNTDQGNRNPTNDLNPESKFLFQRLESIYKGVEKLRKFVHKPHHSSESLAHFHYRTWISISYIHNCFNRKLDNSQRPQIVHCLLAIKNKYSSCIFLKPKWKIMIFLLKRERACVFCRTPSAECRMQNAERLWVLWLGSGNSVNGVQLGFLNWENWPET